jgi:hypothetical protein
MRKILLRGLLLFFFAGLLVLIGVMMMVNQRQGGNIVFYVGVFGELTVTIHTIISAVRYRNKKSSDD